MIAKAQMTDVTQTQNSRIPQRLDQEDGLSASRESDSFAFPFFREVWMA